MVAQLRQRSSDHLSMPSSHWAVAAFLALTTLGCSRTTSENPPFASAEAVEKKVLRIGYQRSSSLLNLLRTREILEGRLGKRVQVVWQQFAAGPQMLEALNVGSVDFGTCGEAPPVFAQAAGAPLLYVALERVGPTAEAILVRPAAAYRSLADLKGKRIALNKGSNVHYFLVRALEEAGMTYQDIIPVFLPPADARAAFESGRVDAWAIWDPFFAAAVEAGQARVLIDGTGIVENFQYYLATRRLAAEQPETLLTVLAELRQINDWAESHRREVTSFLAGLLELDLHVLEVAEQRRVYGVEPIGPETVAYQQRIADTFFRLGLLPNKIDVAQTIWASQ
jgi:sulfonate transport system substrate-binding protein